MNTQVVEAGSPHAIELALKTLREGGLIAFPTDTVYGLGALAFDEPAVQSIYAAKGRGEEKAIPVLLGEAEQLDQVALALPDRARRLAEHFWPGPLTLVVLKAPGLPAAISATDTVGLRVPDHPMARALLRAAGPMAVTSANISGQPSPRTANEVRAQLEGRVALIIDGGWTPGGVPSTVLDCTKPELLILRQGPINLEEIRRVLAGNQF
jgi:L-threonylcarbamoyladenylate synthase